MPAPAEQHLRGGHLDHAETAFADALDRIRTTRPAPEVVVAELVTLATRENTPFGKAIRRRTCVKVELLVAGVDSKVHQIVLDGASAGERAARTQLVIEQTVPALRQ